MASIMRAGVGAALCIAGATAGLWLVPEAGPAAVATAAMVAAPKSGALVRFEAVRRAGVGLAAGACVGDGAEESERFVESQVVVLRSRAVLEKVVAEPSVRGTRWAQALAIDTPAGQARAVELLGEMLTCSVNKGTGFFEVRAAVGDGAEARVLVNAVADVYVLEARARRREAEAPLQTVLEERLRTLDAEVRSLDVQRASMAQSRGLTGVDSAWTLTRVEAEAAVRTLAALRAELGTDMTPEQAVALGDRLRSAGDAVEILRAKLNEETASLFELQELAARRTALLERRARAQDQLDDLNAAVWAGTVVRVVERPALVVPDDGA